MIETKSVMIAGDWHCNARWAVHAIREGCSQMTGKPKVILQLGDFGLLRQAEAELGDPEHETDGLGGGNLMKKIECANPKCGNMITRRQERLNSGLCSSCLEARIYLLAKEIDENRR